MKEWCFNCEKNGPKCDHMDAIIALACKTCGIPITHCDCSLEPSKPVKECNGTQNYSDT